MTGVHCHLRGAPRGLALSVDFTLPARGMSALFGPSGAGKTTVLRALAGLDRAEGHVEVLGEVWQDDARGVFVPPHRRGVGYVFQEANLFAHLDVRANLAFGWQRVATERREPSEQRRVTFDRSVDLFDLGSLLARHPTTLSGGESQRVAIARALLASPRLLLLDEPLAALDLARRAELLPYLERLHAELAIPAVLVSHAADEVARLADYLVLLDGGTVRAAGALDTLLGRLDIAAALHDEAGSVLRATVTGYDAQAHLAELTFAGGRLLAPGRLARIGDVVRCRVLARDVSVALERPVATSILNVLPAVIAEVVADGPGVHLVRLDLGGAAVVARLTTKSVDALHLAPGLPVWAQIKGVALLAPVALPATAMHAP
ncbi:MAG: molybdenum ABC transporter ATP-binding protein [Myxococcales bacterium]|nr:molybdenum ABC transporter ATP-binding protein [Myxococcales bacterium]